MSTYTNQIDWTYRRRGGQWFANAFDYASLIRPALDTIQQGDVVNVVKKDGEVVERVVFRIEDAKRYGEKMGINLALYTQADAEEMLEKAIEFIAKSEKAKKADTAIKHLETAKRSLGTARNAMDRNRWLGIRAKRGLTAKINKVDKELSGLI